MPGAGLPLHSAVHEKKIHRSQASWTKPVLLPIPGVQTRNFRLVVPNTPRLHYYLSRLGRRRGPLLLCFACMAMVMTVFTISKGFGGHDMDPWPSTDSNHAEPPTLVFRRADLQRIWEWEIASGNYPSRQSIPKQIGFDSPPSNPAVPPQRTTKPSKYRPPSSLDTTGAGATALGVGPKRVYLDIQSSPPHVSYPPRPVPGSIADMDIVMEHCDFSQGKYVRDCLEVMRLGGGLDNGQRTRRGNMDDWKYIYLEANSSTTTSSSEDTVVGVSIRIPTATEPQLLDPDAGLQKKPRAEWEPQLVLPPPSKPQIPSTPTSPCEERLFHMFWTGPITDKPYLALLSFLFTQNTGIHDPENTASPVCRPQFWLWINPGPAASVPNPNALHDMYEQLKLSPWASPFLHPRFKDVIKFKLWNTTEQLDGVPEIKNEWRALKDSLFNSGGYVISVASEKSTSTVNGSSTVDDDDMANRAGSKSPEKKDKLSVVLSDMVRFILCHRFGGIYLDADTLLLRDWEEVWGWKGAFAYRWSRLEKYNTAVLHMNKGSSLGTFLFRTALKNGLDFHPMTVSRYIADAHLDGLLLRLPDALFDSAWLNTEYYQRDRPPQPYFTEFSNFFDTPAADSAAPQALGFDGFFKGAYSYHFHGNFWWQPFDPSRNYPDLGPRFIASENMARTATESSDSATLPEGKVTDDKRDLDWCTVVKRTFESYIRGDRPNMYGEWIHW